MIQDPGVRSRLDALAYHRYGGDTEANLAAIGERAATHGLYTGMSERGGAGPDALVQDLRLAGASFWQQWAIAGNGDDRGWFYYLIDFDDPSAPDIRLSRTARRLQQYFRYVRRGDVRIGAVSSDDATCAPVAFADPGRDHRGRQEPVCRPLPRRRAAGRHLWDHLQR